MIMVGYCCEGSIDSTPLEIIIKRLLYMNGYKTSFDKNAQFIAHTGIIGNVATYTKEFFQRCSVDIGFYFTDQDTYQKDRYYQVAKEIKSVDESYITKACIGIANPHFEEWLLADEDVVKKVLRLDGTQRLSHRRLEPKDRLISILNSSKSSLYLEDLKREIATQMNLNILIRKCSGFKVLNKNVKSALKSN